MAWGATALVVTGIAAAAFFWQVSLGYVQDNDSIFKLIGLGFGPLLATLGFFWGLVDKAELKDLAEELGNAQALADAEKRAADQARTEVEAKVKKIESLEHDLSTIADSGRLWKLRPKAPFADYRAWKYDPSGAKIVTIGLFKGGVGKTHLAANFAAYVSEKQQKPVLLIDLDYQGSLSTAILSAAGIEAVGSYVDHLIAENAGLATLSQYRVHLAKQGEDTALNHGQGLARGWIVPADYTLAKVESELLIERVMRDISSLDERYRLAHVLLHPDVRREYSMIVLDTPPRMTLGTVNALVASHAYVVPTILDRVSVEAVRPFLAQVELLKSDLELDLPLRGIVAMKTRTQGLSDAEQRFWNQIAQTTKDVLRVDTDFRISRNLPQKVQITNSDDLGYFVDDANGPLAVQFYDPIFDELWNRIMSPQNQAN